MKLCFVASMAIPLGSLHFLLPSHLPSRLCALDVVSAAQSNRRITKASRRTQFDEQQLLPFDLDDQDDEIDLLSETMQCFSDSEEMEVRPPESTWSSKKKQMGTGKPEVKKNNSQWTKRVSRARQKDKDFALKLTTIPRQSWEDRAYEIIRRQKLRNMSIIKEQNKNHHQIAEEQIVSCPTPSLPAKIVTAGRQDDTMFYRLARQHDLDNRWQPLIQYLHSLGLEEKHLQKIADRHRICFQLNLAMVKERLAYLNSLGIKEEGLCKMIVRHPQILGYTVERMMKPRINYLRSIGIPDSKLSRVLTVAPSLLECSVEKSLKPKVKFLQEEVNIMQGDLRKIVVLSPQLLTQSLDEALRPRLEFFATELGANRDTLTKMIKKHPQLLHYSIAEGIKPRIEFLRRIGMSDPIILVVLRRCTQILSLSVEKSLEPKFHYLTAELKCGLEAVTSFPAYFSLSLDQRIKSRHKFLVINNRLPSGPFPMHLLAVTDHEYCKRWAKSTLDEYYSFRNGLLLSGFVKEFERKNRLACMSY